VDISDQNVVSEGPVTVEKLWWSQTRQESHSFTFSFEVEVPEEAVDAYLDYQMELQLQEDAWRGPPLTFRYYLRLMRKKYYLDNVLRILRNGPDKEYTPPAKPPAQGMAPPPQARPAAPKPAVPKPPPPKPPPAKAPTMSPDEPVA
jgi:hypothetical protein